MKICIHRDDFTPADMLDTFRRMTPGGNGRWKDMQAVTDYESADFIVVIDDTKQTFPPEKLIYLGSHPTNNVHYVNYAGAPCRRAIDVRYEMGFNEWWLRHSYDELVALAPPAKSKRLVCIMSNSSRHTWHQRRRAFMQRFTARAPDDFELYGRIQAAGPELKFFKGALGTETASTYWFGKEPIYTASRYALEFDDGPCRHYISERFFDAMLLWCMPLYWGGTNVHDYLPPESFCYIDVDGNGDDALAIADSDFRELNLSAMAEARDLILNKYQIWPRLYELIQGL